MSDHAQNLTSHLERAMRPGAGAREVLESLLEASREWICAPGDADLTLSPPDDDRSLGSQLARHASAVLGAGGTPPEALDSCLVRLLYSGESEALRQDPSGDPDADPAGVRPIAASLADYPGRILDRAPERPKVLRNRSSNLQLMITRRCQLRCSYCPVVKQEVDMDRGTIDAAMDLLFRTSRDSVRLDITGGEPLLRFDEVQRAAMRALTASITHGKDVSFYMVTNGFELTRARAEELASYGFRVELSLDGPARIHNRAKIPLEPSDDPYARTVSAIEAALDARLPHTVVMVATPETVGSLRTSFEHAMGLGVRRIDVNYAIGRMWDEDALDAYLEAMTSIVDEHAPLLRAGRLHLGNLTSRVEPAVLNAEWMVETDGSLHLMTEWALESSRPEPLPPNLGSVHGDTTWDSLFRGRFHAYAALLENYSWKDARLRTLLHNNVQTGRSVSKHVSSLRRRFR